MSTRPKSAVSPAFLRKSAEQDLEKLRDDFEHDNAYHQYRKPEDERWAEAVAKWLKRMQKAGLGEHANMPSWRWLSTITRKQWRAVR